MFVDILDNKRALLDYKNVDLEKVEKNAFLQGVSLCSGQRLDIFSFAYFRQNRPRKWVWWYSRQKKSLSML